MLFSLVVHQLHLTCVRELDDSADGHLELPALGVVEPHMVALRERERDRERWGDGGREEVRKRGKEGIVQYYVGDVRSR